MAAFGTARIGPHKEVVSRPIGQLLLSLLHLKTSKPMLAYGRPEKEHLLASRAGLHLPSLDGFLKTLIPPRKIPSRRSNRIT